MNPYVYKMLDTYGNTVISKKLYKRLGEKRILDILKSRGYDCEIEISKHEDADMIDSISHQRGHWTSVIVRVKQ